MLPAGWRPSAGSVAPSRKIPYAWARSPCAFLDARRPRGKWVEGHTDSTAFRVDGIPSHGSDADLAGCLLQHDAHTLVHWMNELFHRSLTRKVSDRLKPLLAAQDDHVVMVAKRSYLIVEAGKFERSNELGKNCDMAPRRRSEEDLSSRKSQIVGVQNLPRPEVTKTDQSLTTVRLLVALLGTELDCDE